MLNNRQVSILQLLLKQNEPIPAEIVGNLVGISARSVRYNLSPIKKWLIKYKVILVKKRGVGLCLSAEKDQREELSHLLNNIPQQNYYLNQQNRCIWIEFELLNISEPYKASNFQKSLGISHTTVYKDLLYLEKKLPYYGLTLFKTPGLGTSIIGPEIKYRYRFITLIREVVGESALVDICLWGKNPIDNLRSERAALSNKVLESIESWKLHEAWWLLNNAIKELNYKVSDLQLVTLILYISCSKKRISQGYTIELSNDKLHEIKNWQEFSDLKSLVSPFYNCSQPEILDSEIGRLAMELRCYKLNNHESMDQEDLYNKMLISAEKILTMAGDEIGCNLIIPEVVNMLAKHLVLSFNHFQNNVPINNPILDDIQNKYADSLNIVWNHLEQLTALVNFEIPISEVAYIALYIEMAKHEAGLTNLKKRKDVVVVCPTGGITVGILVLQLKNEMPDINVVEVLSIREFKKKTFDTDIDAVITTSPSLDRDGMNVICVNPLLTKEDLNKISQLLNMDKIFIKESKIQ